MEEYLRSRFSAEELTCKTLLGSKATRQAIVYELGTGLFLNKGRCVLPTKEDIVLFFFCGHGSQEAAPIEFRGGKLETFLCYDSRTAGQYDLADKEIAALLAHIAVNDPHLVLIFDSCHSGSITRSLGKQTMGQSRLTRPSGSSRPLQAFLPEFYPAEEGRKSEGYYERRYRELGDKMPQDESIRSFPELQVPKARHILLSACSREELAVEYDTGGVFSSALLDVLQSEGTLSYASLFSKVRTVIRHHAYDQHPQFETYLGFNAYASFLQDGIDETPPSAHVRLGQDQESYRSARGGFRRTPWILDRGALHGIPTDAGSEIQVEIVLNERKVARANIIEVRSRSSKLRLLEGRLDRSINTYLGRITSLPAEPLFLQLHLNHMDDQVLDQYGQIKDALQALLPLIFDAPKSEFSLLIDKRDEWDKFFRFRLLEVDQTTQIGAAIGSAEVVAAYLYSQVLAPVYRWRMFRQLQNNRPQLDPDQVVLEILTYEQEDRAEVYQDHCQLVCRQVQEDGEEYWDSAPYELSLTNGTGQRLFATVYELYPAYGFESVTDQTEIPAGHRILLPFIETDADGQVVGETNRTSQYIPGDHQGPCSSSTYKVILSTERMDDFFWQQDELDLEHEENLTEVLRNPEEDRTSAAPRTKVVFHDWFTLRLDMTLIKEEIP